jgi:hypothetical protein
MPTTYQQKVEDLVGAVSDTDFLTDVLTATAAEIARILPKAMLEKHGTLSAGGDLVAGIDVADKLLLFVFVGTAQERAQEISPGMAGRAAQVNSMYFGSAQNPVFYVQAQLVLSPQGTGGTDDNILTYDYPAVAFDDTAIALFPHDLEYSVAIGAAVKVASFLMNAARADMPTLILPGVPVAPGNPEFTYTDAEAAAISAIVIDPLGAAPEYNAPVPTIDFISFDGYQTDEDVELSAERTWISIINYKTLLNRCRSMAPSSRCMRHAFRHMRPMLGRSYLNFGPTWSKSRPNTPNCLRSCKLYGHCTRMPWPHISEVDND